MVRGNRARTRNAVSCLHCGRAGHTAYLCPRDDYSPDIPALSCNQCARRVITATGDNQFQMYCGIDPCPQHSTLTAQPPSQSTPSAMSTAMASLPGPSTGSTPAGPPPPYSQHANPSGSNPPPPNAAGPSQPTNPAGATTSNPAGPSQPPNAVQVADPASRRNNRSYSFPDINCRYGHLTSLVLGGTSMADALDTINVKGRTFRRWRIVAEARLVDEQAFNTLVGRIQNPTLDDCVAQGKTILQRSSSHAKLNSLFLAGACLKPMPKRN